MKMKVLVLLLGVAFAGPRQTVCPETATVQHPHATYCMCNRGKYLKVKTTGSHIGYYCATRARAAGRCSMSQAHPTYRECICHRPYAKASKRTTHTVHGRRTSRVGYFCKRSHAYRDCPQSAYCLFNPVGMTSAQYNTQVRHCNANMDTTFASVQRESTSYCVCGSAAWKRANPGHQNFYLRYTYHRTTVHGKAKYTRGYVCMPRFKRQKKKCPANVSRDNPSTSFCQCNTGERRMSTMRRQGARRRRVYWCQRVAPCDTTNANAVSSVYCSCPKNQHQTLRYVRGVCHAKRTNYTPTGCNLRYKGYRIGFCFDNNKRTRERRNGHANRTNANRNRQRSGNRRGGRRPVTRRGGRRGGAARRRGGRTTPHRTPRRRLPAVHGPARPRRGGRRPTRGRTTRGRPGQRGRGRPGQRGRGGRTRPGGRRRTPNRHRRALEHQCCKRVACLNREVGYYCYKRSNCATAQLTRPSRTFCHCARGTHLKYTQRYKGYYCQHLHHCSMSASTPTATQCTCRSGYRKVHQNRRRGNGHNGAAAGHYTKRGWHCARRTRNCPTYNHSAPNRGSRSYNCGCATGKTVHYYRYHNVFYKSCVTHRAVHRTAHRRPTRPHPRV